jgi:hypothetical protein
MNDAKDIGGKALNLAKDHLPDKIPTSIEEAKE